MLYNTVEDFNTWFDPMFDDLYDAIDTSNKVDWFDGICGDAPLENPQLNELISITSDHHLINFYKYINQWKVHWKTNKNSEVVNTEGVFNLWSIEKVCYDWDGELGGNGWAPNIKGFRPLDMFCKSVGCVGFYVNKNDKKGLYLYKFDGETVPLHLDFEGYLKLLTLSKGFSCWQNAIVEISTGKSQPNVDMFKEQIPTLFPDFDWNEFVQLYQAVKINTSG